MKSIQLPDYLYAISLFLLIFLTAACIAISAADVTMQAIADGKSSESLDFRNLIVITASYVVLALCSLFFSCNRVLSVRGSMQNIPKTHIPIRRNDLPEKVHVKMKKGFAEVKMIRENNVPRTEDILAVGWAKPGTPLFEGLDFKQAVSRTPSIVENVATNIDPGYKRPHYCPVRQYIDFLIQEGLVDKQLGTVYVQGYEIARFSRDPLSQQQYMDIMKHLAALLQNMGYNIKATVGKPTGHQTGNDAESTISSRRTGSSSSYSFRLQDLVSRPISADDAISLAQSMNTWASRTTRLQRILTEEDYSIYDEEEVRHDIYKLLMTD